LKVFATQLFGENASDDVKSRCLISLFNGLSWTGRPQQPTVTYIPPPPPPVFYQTEVIYEQQPPYYYEQQKPLYYYDQQPQYYEQPYYGNQPVYTTGGVSWNYETINNPVMELPYAAPQVPFPGPIPQIGYRKDFAWPNGLVQNVFVERIGNFITRIGEERYNFWKSAWVARERVAVPQPQPQVARIAVVGVKTQTKPSLSSIFMG